MTIRKLYYHYITQDEIDNGIIYIFSDSLRKQNIYPISTEYNRKNKILIIEVIDNNYPYWNSKELNILSTHIF